MSLTNVKKFFRKHQDDLLILMILLALYLGESAIRPLAAPMEYIFIDKLHLLLPEYPDSKLLLRLPSVLATFAGAGAVLLLGKLWNFKHPERAAVFYLLFPPVFYIGTAATLMPLLSAGIMLALYGLLQSSRCSAFKKRFLTILSVLPMVIATAVYVDSAWCTVSDIWMVGTTAAALVIIQYFNYLEQDKERAARCLDRFSRLMSILLILLALLVIIPVLLRHFKVDFPPQFALYRKGERIIRPLIMLILPVIWFNLARNAKKNSKKLLLTGGAAAFLLFTLPITLPWHIQKEIYWHLSFEKISRELPGSGVICYAEKRYLPFFRECFKYNVLPIGKANGETAPENLGKAVAETLKKNDVLIVCSSDRLEKFCPVYAGKRYGIGKFRLYHYFRNGVEKK